MSASITTIIIAKDEEAMIANCLATLSWCGEVLVIDNGSSDRTRELAERHGAKVISFASPSFARLREEGLKRATSDWVFYIDADERVIPKLAQEITVHVETNAASALQLHRQNMMYGKVFHYGGWGNEVVTRIFRKDVLESWKGDIHESPVFTGQSTLLHAPLIHLTHRNTVDGLHKTIQWTPIEARLLAEAGLPKVKIHTILRKGVMEFFRRGLFWKGRKDGEEGWIEAIVQGINRMLVYIQVWELQQKPALEEKYKEAERQIAELWDKKVTL